MYILISIIFYMINTVEYMESDREIYCGSSMDVGSISSTNCNTSNTDNVLLLLFRGITFG